MDAYARSVFLRLMDAALATPAIARLRRDLLDRTPDDPQLGLARRAAH